MKVDNFILHSALVVQVWTRTSLAGVGHCLCHCSEDGIRDTPEVLLGIQSCGPSQSMSRYIIHTGTPADMKRTVFCYLLNLPVPSEFRFYTAGFHCVLQWPIAEVLGGGAQVARYAIHGGHGTIVLASRRHFNLGRATALLLRDVAHVREAGVGSASLVQETWLAMERRLVWASLGRLILLSAM